MTGRDVARQQASLGEDGRPDETAGRTSAGESLRWEGIQDELVGRIARLEDLLADAAAAAASLRELLEPIGSLSRFMRELETSMDEVRGVLDHSRASVTGVGLAPIRSGARHVAEVLTGEAPAEEQDAVGAEPPGPPATLVEEAPAEEQDVVGAEPPGPPPTLAEEAPAEEEVAVKPVAPSEPRTGRPILLRLESAEGYLDLMTVDRVLREDPNIADLELAEYGGKKATIRVWLSGDGEPSDEVVSKSVEVIQASLQESSSGITVNVAEEQQED